MGVRSKCGVGESNCKSKVLIRIVSHSWHVAMLAHIELSILICLNIDYGCVKVMNIGLEYI